MTAGPEQGPSGGAPYPEQFDGRLRDAIAEALRDPLRTQVYLSVADRPGATIAQIANRIDEPERRVRHQVERLVELGLVEVDSETQRRNTRERHYRVLVMPTVERYADWSEDGRRKVSLSMVRQLVFDLSRASRDPRFGTLEGHTAIRVPGEVDQEGWDALALIMRRALEEAEEVMVESAARLDAAGEAGIEAMGVMLLFEGRSWTAPGEEPDGPRPSVWSPEGCSGQSHD
jgi:DNA-binding transcriptional ArsR family regulator